MFVDAATIEVFAGPGGAGAEAFRRETGVPRGGPSGGDGGHGGSVIMVADPRLTTLSDLRYRRHHKADRGQHGQGSNRTGRSGKDLLIPVPRGTVVIDDETDMPLGELLTTGDTLVVAKGGRGGRGNARFATATRQAPRHWEPGEDGEERTVRLELKLLADVGLVGEPNAGKSTLLARVSRARPKVADYPFTTLTPNLGVVELADFRSFVMADIPGLIEGAHEGKGLGHQFLKHIERTRILVILLPVDGEDPQKALDTLRSELAQYSAHLAALPFCVAFSKTDLLPPDEALPTLTAPDAWGQFALSSATGAGVTALLEGCWQQLEATKSLEDAEEGVW